MIPLIGSENWDEHLDDTPAPEPCPRCGGWMGDGDRVSHGKCGRCVHYVRRRR